jgi:hypothetical protein
MTASGSAALGMFMGNQEGDGLPGRVHKVVRLQPASTLKATFGDGQIHGDTKLDSRPLQ